AVRAFLQGTQGGPEQGALPAGDAELRPRRLEVLAHAAAYLHQDGLVEPQAETHRTDLRPQVPRGDRPTLPGRGKTRRDGRPRRLARRAPGREDRDLDPAHALRFRPR